MAVLFIAAISLIFYILLLRAQHLSRMEQQRQGPGSSVEQVAVAPQPLVVVHSLSPDGEPVLARLAFEEPVSPAT
jgi:hypothetical protein